MLEAALALGMLPSVQPVGFQDSGRCGSANGVETRREPIGLKEKEPSCDAKEAPQQPKREGTGSASILETLQVIKPGSRRMHFSFHSSLRRHGKFMGNGELLIPGILDRSSQGSGLEALIRGSSLWVRISSHSFQRSLQEAHCAQASSPANKGTNVQGGCSLLLP